MLNNNREKTLSMIAKTINTPEKCDVFSDLLNTIKENKNIIKDDDGAKTILSSALYIVRTYGKCILPPNENICDPSKQIALGFQRIDNTNTFYDCKNLSKSISKPSEITAALQRQNIKRSI